MARVLAPFRRLRGGAEGISLVLSLNQTILLLGLALFGWMWDIVGALLWVPIMVALRLSAQQIPRLHAVDVFFGRADGREAAAA